MILYIKNSAGIMTEGKLVEFSLDPNDNVKQWFADMRKSEIGNAIDAQQYVIARENAQPDLCREIDRFVLEKVQTAQVAQNPEKLAVRNSRGDQLTRNWLHQFVINKRVPKQIRQTAANILHGHGGIRIVR